MSRSILKVEPFNMKSSRSALFRMVLGFGLVLAVFSWNALGENKPGVNVVKELQISGGEELTKVILRGSQSPTFTVFRLTSPERVVVDIADSDISAIKGPHKGKGPINGITVSQFSDSLAAVGRVVLAMNGATPYDVRGEKNSVVITAGHDTSSTSKKDELGNQTEFEEGVVLARRDENILTRPATQLLGINSEQTSSAFIVNLQTDREVGTIDILELTRPPRLAIDMPGVHRALRTSYLPSSAPIKEVRFGKHPGKTRMVLEARAKDRMPAYQVHRSANGLRIELASSAKPAIAKAPTVVAKKNKSPDQGSSKAAAVREITFEGNAALGKIVVAVPKGAKYKVLRPDPHTAVLTLSHAQLPGHLERSLDTSFYGGPVKMVSSFTSPGNSQSVQIVATLEGEAKDSVYFEKSKLIWTFKTPGAEMVLDGKSYKVEESSAAPKIGGFVSEAPRYAASSAPRRARYTGRLVSFEFKDIDIHNLLRIMAELSRRNIVVADNVAGKITIRLRNVPWDQALDLILKSKKLGKEEFGDIIRVAPLKELEEERKIAESIKASRQKQEPLRVRLIPVNYATAPDISSKVKDLLSERGTVNVDARTNVIIVKDVAEALERAEGLVRRLDTQTPQVLIESRIVEANTSFSREVGIQWGGNISMSPATGNPTGLVFPNVVRMAGASASEGNTGTGDIPNFAVNLPAPIGAGAGGGVGFVFGSAGGAVMLNLRLSAMEAGGQVKTISAPKVTTLDNTEATISQGISIPFSQYSSTGVNTMFVEAKLELKVTPHVTSDGSVLMKIQASNNSPDPSFTGSNGQPSISRKEAQTEVLVNDGDTTVIGGIYTRTQSYNEAAVPWLSKIPVLGWFFKKKAEKDNRTELLIFITPRIINRNQIVAAKEGEKS